MSAWSNLIAGFVLLSAVSKSWASEDEEEVLVIWRLELVSVSFDREAMCLDISFSRIDASHWDIFLL